MNQPDIGSFPTRIDIESTNHCQLHCPMCPRKMMTRPLGFMHLDLVRKVVAEVKLKKGDDFTHIAVHQIGEPLLHPQIVDIISIISDAGIRSVLTTSAYNLTPTLSERLFRAGLGHMSVSLDSIDDSVYSKIRVGSNLAVVMNNLDIALKIRERIDCKTVIDLQTIKMHTTGGQKSAIDQMYGERLAKFGGRVVDKNFAFWGGSVKSLSKPEDEEAAMPCSQMNISLIIQHDGAAVICCLDFDGKTKVGNAYHSTLEELWTGPVYTSHRARIMAGDKTLIPCGKCNHLWTPELKEKEAE